MGTEISGIAKSILQARAELKSSLPGKDSEENVSVSFMQMMSQNQLSSNAGASASGSQQIDITANSKDWAKEAYGSYTASGKAVQVQEAASPEEVMQQAADALETYEKEVVQVLEEELDVTEEEIADAMENLGISFLELRNPQNLAALVQELTGEEVGTLFLSDSFRNVMEQVADLTDALRTELGISKEEWNAFCEEWEQKMEGSDIPVIEVSADTPAIPKMEVPADTQAVPKTEDAPEMQVRNSLEAMPAADDASMQETETVVAEESQPTEHYKQEAGNMTEQAVTVQSKEAQPEQEAPVLESDQRQDQAEGLAQVLPGAGQEEAGTEAEADAHADSEEQSLAGHSKEPKTQDAGHEAVFTGQHPVSQEEFAIPAQAQQNYSSQIDAYDLIEQIARNVRVTFSQTVTSMEMQLNPEHLGKIYLSISEREGAVRAQIAAQNEAVKEALETQVAELRQSLNQQGIKVDAIEVTVATHEFEQNLEQNARQEEQMQRQREEAQKQARKNLNLNDLDGLTGLMTEEEELAARIMRDNGNQVDLTA